ncbi:hypothetical protein GN956_G24994 [Arapaima gigas]
MVTTSLPLGSSPVPGQTRLCCCCVLHGHCFHGPQSAADKACGDVWLRTLQRLCWCDCETRSWIITKLLISRKELSEESVTRKEQD